MNSGEETRGVERKRIKWSKRRISVVGLVVFSSLVSLYSGLSYLMISREVADGQQHLRQAITILNQQPPTTLKVNDLKLADGEFRAAQADFSSARRWLTPLRWIVGPLGQLTGHGADGAALPLLLDIAIDGSKGGDELCNGLIPLLMQLDKPNKSGDTSGAGTSSMGQQLLDFSSIMEEQKGHYTEASLALDRVENNRKQIDADHLTSHRLQGAIGQLDAQLPSVQRLVRSLTTLPTILRTLLGAEKKQNYLLIAENNDELRPTGGFISSVGLIHIERGQISVTDFKDSYAYDNPAVYGGSNPTAPPAPAPLAYYMKSGYWTLRDANWSPDFPTTARAIEALYNLDTAPQNEEVDGVVSVDLVTIKNIVAAIGPLQVNMGGESVTITGDNVNEILQYYFQPAPDAPEDPGWWQHRKDFSGLLFRSIVDKMIHVEHDKLPLLIGALTTSFKQRDVMVYFQDERAASVLADNGWDGSLAPLTSGQDFFALVEANVGFNKVNPRIIRSASYDLALHDDGTATARVTLIYTNTNTLNTSKAGDACILEAKYGSSYKDMENRCYWNYLRLYVPSGSSLNATEGFSDKVSSGSDLRRSTFGGYLIVPRGSSRTVVLTYTVAPAIIESLKQGHYTLINQPQAGTSLLDPFKVTLNLPPGYSLHTGSQDLIIRGTGNQLEFNLHSATTEKIELNLQK